MASPGTTRLPISLAVASALGRSRLRDVSGPADAAAAVVPTWASRVARASIATLTVFQRNRPGSAYIPSSRPSWQMTACAPPPTTFVSIVTHRTVPDGDRGGGGLWVDRREDG